MSLNHHLPTRECASVAALLPLAAHDLLSEQEAARLQTHLATCAHCRAELALDAQIEAALRRSYAPPEDSSPLLSREEIAALSSVPAAQAAPKASASARQTQTPPPVIPALAERPARRWLGGLPALAATLVIILLTVTIFGIPGLFPGLRRSAAQPPNLVGITLTSISMVSASEGWAVGNTKAMVQMGANVVNAGGGDPVILHYKDARWTPEPLPNLMSHFHCNDGAIGCTIALTGISMVSAQDGWAVGSTVPPPNVEDAGSWGILLHYTGGRWTLVDMQMEHLTSISMRSSTDGWMIGSAPFWGGGKPAGLLHYDGHAWTSITDPAFDQISLTVVQETPNGQVWISGVDYSASVGNGEDGNNPAVLLHYDGQRWSKIDPHVANAQLSGFAFISPDEGWAVGTLPNTDQHRPSEMDGLILHYAHSVWQQQKHFKDPLGQSSFSFSGVAMVSPDEGWAVGDEGVILHYHNGAWGEFQNPTGQALNSVVMVSPDEGWAVGDGVIVHYQAGSWRVYNG